MFAILTAQKKKKSEEYEQKWDLVEGFCLFVFVRASLQVFQT